MRKRWIFASVAAVSGFLIAGTAGTAALWRDQGTINPGTVSIGSLVLLNGDQTSQVKNFQLDAFGSTALAPGTGRQAPVVVKNGGSTPFSLDMSGISATPTGQGSLLLGSFTVTVAQVDSVTSCPAGAASPVGQQLYQGPQQSSARFSSQPRLAAGASLVLCLQGSLGSNAPQASGGSGFQLSFGFRADQVR
ncbi:hypothetical protein [Arthrobacter russicus]|jgi:hypothetical protein|uniref:SipW-cognate class signal peptide n=1 Tax=Arthrobacter russicus TaxID=172040 RepID=A0ABU1J9C1_9MICC|nr:hypothetical protein [Arthrobacter russicus]MDR6269014.1 hypothetical protein [Arthrobacter russicus]